MTPDLDRWLSNPTLRVVHRRASSAEPDRLWRAAREVRVRDTARLGRLVRWRIPGTTADQSFDELFRNPPFTVLSSEGRELVVGIVGRIWTLRRDYPRLEGPEQFRDWSKPGTVRVLFANWVEPTGAGARSTLVAEVRVQAFGVQGRVGLSMVRPLIRGAHELIGRDGITAAVRRAERPNPAPDRGA